MFRKPGFPILLCLVTLLTIGFPSCEGPDYVALTDIRELGFYDYSSREFLSAPFITDSDSLSLYIDLEWTSFSFFELEGTMTEAWAFQTSEPEFANEITDIRIFCDNTIFGAATGMNIASLVKYDISYNHAQYLANLPSKGDIGYGFNYIQVFLHPRPAAGHYTFIVEIEDNNGHVLRGTSPTIEWL